MGRRAYSPEVKGRALAALLAGHRVREVSREHGVPENTVKTWRRRLRTGDLKPEKKGVGGGSLFSYLEASLISLTQQSEELARPERLEEMSARDLAICFGTLFDRTLRMLEMLPAFVGDRVSPGRGEGER